MEVGPRVDLSVEVLKRTLSDEGFWTANLGAPLVDYDEMQFLQTFSKTSNPRFSF